MAALSKLLKYLMKFHNETSQTESDPEVIPISTLGYIQKSIFHWAFKY